MNLTSPRDLLIARLGLVATGAYCILAAELSKSTGATNSHDEVVLGEMFLYLFAFGLFILAATSSPLMRFAGGLALAGALAGVSISIYSTIQGVGEGNYLFDIMPLTHRSAEMVLDGDNPYSIRNDPDFIRENARRFNAPLITYTREGDGEIIDQLLTYPAGHVLPFLPAAALDLKDMRWVTTVATLGVVAALWLAAPPFLRPLAALPFLVNTLVAWIGPSLGGLTDSLWLLALMGMVYTLHYRRFGWAAVFYGIAASMRQQVWLLVPFLLLWLWKQDTTARPTKAKVLGILQISGVCLATFFLINLPFIIWDPVDWYHGVTYVIFTDHGNWGTGLSDIRFFGINQGQTFYSVMSLAAMIVLLVAYMKKFEQLEHAIWIFPAVILWFTQRPLTYYFYPWFLLLMFALFLMSRTRSADEGETEDETASVGVG